MDFFIIFSDLAFMVTLKSLIYANVIRGTANNEQLSSISGCTKCLAFTVGHFRAAEARTSLEAPLQAQPHPNTEPMGTSKCGLRVLRRVTLS